MGYARFHRLPQVTIYRSLEHVERVVVEAEAGRYEGIQEAF